jgi:hypothetical protein
MNRRAREIPEPQFRRCRIPSKSSPDTYGCADRRSGSSESAPVPKSPHRATGSSPSLFLSESRRIVVRQSSTTVRQREARDRTRDEVRSGRSAPQFGLDDRKDAVGVAPAPSNADLEREDRVLRRSVAGRDCSAAATTTELVADGPRSTVSSNPGTRAAVSGLTFRTANWPAGCEPVSLRLQGRARPRTRPIQGRRWRRGHGG